LAGKRLERGTLVSMTGENGRLEDRKDAEILYGVKPTAKANDPAVLGSYLSIHNPEDAERRERKESTSNPSLVTAVGNGEMWVADNGRDIAPGDGLISSDVTGHAMKDPGTYAASHVVAKAAERVDWSAVKEEVDGAKHKKISVLFESFDRTNAQESAETPDTESQTDDVNLIAMAVAGSAVVQTTLIIIGAFLYRRLFVSKKRTRPTIRKKD
jgi:hypothetical protein